MISKATGMPGPLSVVHSSATITVAQVQAPESNIAADVKLAYAWIVGGRREPNATNH